MSGALILLLALGVLACVGGVENPRADTPSYPGAPVVLISIDTLRADHLPAHGYGGVETPAVDRLRADSILFSRAYSHSPLTLPSHASILTGRLPIEHGVRNNLGYLFDAAAHPTVAGALEARGYETGAAVSAYVLRSSSGLGDAFGFYDDAVPLQGLASAGMMQRPGEATAEVARSWIAPRAERPFFFLLHLFEPHTPYEPPEPFRSRYELAYDGEIAAADAIVGSFLDFLREQGIYDRAIVVLLSDHGEGLLDHGEDEHGIFLYREAIHVPLMLKLPGQARAGETVSRPVGLVDIVPTVLELCAIEAPAGLRGMALHREPDDAHAGVPIVSETLYPRIHFGWSELRSVISGPHHFIDAPRPELYDVVADPGERTDLSVEKAAVMARLREHLASFAEPTAPPPAIDPDEADMLRALGYVGAAAAEPASGPLPDPKDRIGVLVAMREAVEIGKQGRHGEAILRLREVVADSPRLTDAWLHLAGLCRRAGRWQEAADAYVRVIEISPDISADTAASLATVYLRMNRLDDAEHFARRAVASGSGAGSLLLGRVELARHRYAEAESHARRAMEDSLYRVHAAVLLAEAITPQGNERLPEALAVLESALAQIRSKGLDPVRRLHFVHGDVLARLGRLTEAEAALLAEIRLFPDNPMAYTSLAIVHYMGGARDQAHAALEKLTQANPSPMSYLLAARTCEQVGDAAAAASWRRRLAALREGR